MQENQMEKKCQKHAEKPGRQHRQKDLQVDLNLIVVRVLDITKVLKVKLREHNSIFP